MVRPVRVVPSILTDDPTALEAMVRQAESFTSYVQFDIMDGEFVPSRSITHEHLAALHMKLHWETHLMVRHPEEHFDAYRKAGTQKVIFHFEATSSPKEAIARARHLDLQVGLAVNPDTPVAAILPLADSVDSVLFLTVSPGFYGSRFIPEVLDKLAELRRGWPEIEIGVDGGIKEGNLGQVVKLGADVIYVGSAIMLQPDPADSFRRLQALAQDSGKHADR